MIKSLNTTELLNKYFSARAFWQGISVTCIILGLLWLVTYLQADKTIARLENMLSNQTVYIENLDKPDEALTSMFGDEVPAMENIIAVDSIEGRQELYPAPINGLYERTPIGIIPKISQNNITPFDAYKKPFVKTDKPLIAIAFVDFGLKESASKEILAQVPDTVTLITSPYVQDLPQWQNAARKLGFETWMHIPVENKDLLNNDSGSKTLISEYDLRENEERLRWSLTRASGYAGIAIHSDNVLAQSAPLMTMLTADIFNRGLGVFEMNKDAPITVETIAAQSEGKYLKNQANLNEGYLKSLEKKAREDGYVVGIVRPYPNSIKAIKIWSQTLEAKGFALAPLSAIIDQK